MPTSSSSSADEPLVPHPSAHRPITELPPRAAYRTNATGASAYAPIRKARSFRSKALGRTVRTEIFLPPAVVGTPADGPVLYLNDGQDADAVALPATLERLWAANALPPLTVIAIHANAERMQEYGVAFSADARGRGAKAGRHTRFVTDELMPFITATYRPLTGPRHTAFAGFSLGGLSALDIVWNHPQLFGTAGVFSGSLWWRGRDLRDPLYTDADRLMHQQLAATSPVPAGLRFWFQTGTEDEKNDRNHNGVIDSIDDTLDALNVLSARGYPIKDLYYLEIEGGRHHQSTWAEAMPSFLVWAFG